MVSNCFEIVGFQSAPKSIWSFVLLVEAVCSKFQNTSWLVSSQLRYIKAVSNRMEHQSFRPQISFSEMLNYDHGWLKNPWIRLKSCETSTEQFPLFLIEVKKPTIDGFWYVFVILCLVGMNDHTFTPLPSWEDVERSVHPFWNCCCWWLHDVEFLEATLGYPPSSTSLVHHLRWNQ